MGFKTANEKAAGPAEKVVLLRGFTGNEGCKPKAGKARTTLLNYFAGAGKSKC